MKLSDNIVACSSDCGYGIICFPVYAK